MDWKEAKKKLLNDPAIAAHYYASTSSSDSTLSKTTYIFLGSAGDGASVGV